MKMLLTIISNVQTKCRLKLISKQLNIQAASDDKYIWWSTYQGE